MCATVRKEFEECILLFDVCKSTSVSISCHFILPLKLRLKTNISSSLNSFCFCNENGNVIIWENESQFYHQRKLCILGEYVFILIQENVSNKTQQDDNLLVVIKERFWIWTMPILILSVCVLCWKEIRMILIF